ncbi:PLD-like domain-containing protein [Fictibacillus solisalsi]|uniref:PLD-like domain-containing protein n=1 Tax=Fictibacillus solisalsi TaxID=459525 RepID=A0A1H0BZM7_9BACL|nr:phospholipase D family protein [Fictibacillus solisalsi]SDN51168.1 PLD-like domain-containing protein [Fictibacillus solisalsi]
MNVKIISQPISNSVGSIINDLAKEDWNSFYCMVAYAKSSGVLRIEPSIRELKDKGTKCYFVVGIDQKNTSYEALEQLHELVDELYIYHNEDINSTFHPKIYLFENDEKAVVIVGSNNLTGGGLYTNNEQSIEYSMDLRLKEDLLNYQMLLDTYKMYSNEQSELSNRVDLNFLKQLNDNNYTEKEYQLEKQRKRKMNIIREKLFGFIRVIPPKLPKKKNMESTSKVLGKERKVNYKILHEGFWKRLSKWDVSPTSAPGQIVIPIRFMPLFPNFSGLLPTPMQAQQEEVYFNVLFIDEDGTQILLKNTRAIHYVPAATHGRPNPELRFTFLNKKVFNVFKKDDVLAFYKTDEENIEFIIKRNPTLAENGKKFGFFE